jgi:Ca2+-binding EF-hand superfamily protein
LPVQADRAKPRQPSGPVLVLPGAKGPCRLRLDLVVDGRSPLAAWDLFLDKLFDHFDADGDGWLSRAEAARIMPLPLPGGRHLVIDFARLAAENGKVTRAGLKAFCRANGFTPIVVVVTPPSANDLHLANLFLRCLDADGNGRLTPDELRRVPAAFREFDLNEDEYLDLEELLTPGRRARRSVAARVKVDPVAREKDQVLRLDLSTKGRARLEEQRAPSLKLGAPPQPGGLYRLHGPENWWVTFRAVQTTPDVRSAGDFLIAQFNDARGSAPALTKADLEEDAALAGFLDLLPYADRNGDGRLTLDELKGYLDLVELGMRAQVVVAVRDRDHNPFDFLDSDGDGRLSYLEQVSAPTLLGGKAEVKGLPLQFDLSFGGPAVKSWGGVAIPAVKRPIPPPVDVSGAPAWFRAMDRNGDGVISPREFIGPPEVFRRLDINGDGVISPAEAARAGRR